MHTDVDDRLSFLNFSQDDRDRLVALAPALERHADDLVAAFYRHLLAFPETRRLLRDPVVKDRLLSVQRRYLLSLADPALDSTYFEERRRIGETHDRIGLEPRWYLGAYALYLSQLIPVIGSEFEHEPVKAGEVPGRFVDPGGDLRVWPDQGGGAGHYAARFRRKRNRGDR